MFATGPHTAKQGITFDRPAITGPLALAPVVRLAAGSLAHPIFRADTGEQIGSFRYVS